MGVSTLLSSESVDHFDPHLHFVLFLISKSWNQTKVFKLVQELYCAAKFEMSHLHSDDYLRVFF